MGNKIAIQTISWFSELAELAPLVPLEERTSVLVVPLPPSLASMDSEASSKVLSFFAFLILSSWSNLSLHPFHYPILSTISVGWRLTASKCAEENPRGKKRE